MGGTKAPIHAKVEDQEAGDVLSAAVAHKAGGQEFTHVGVDEGVARPALLPALKIVERAVPRRPIANDTAALEDFVALTEPHVDEEIAPRQLENQPVG